MEPLMDQPNPGQLPQRWSWTARLFCVLALGTLCIAGVLLDRRHHYVASLLLWIQRHRVLGSLVFGVSYVLGTGLSTKRCKR
jgi:hypothetical protein